MTDSIQAAPFARSNTDLRSVYAGSSYDASIVDMSEERFLLMVKYIYGRINVNMWMAAAEDPFPVDGLPVHGVLLRQTRGQYVSQPSQLNPDLVAAVQKINVEVAFTMSTDTSDVIFGTLIDCQNELVLADGSQYQVVDSLADISKGGANKIKKFQYACLVKQEKVVLIWHDDIQKILTHAQEVEQKLLGLIWGQGVPSMFHKDPFLTPPIAGSLISTPTASVYHGAGNYSYGKKGPDIGVEELPTDVVDEERGGAKSSESLGRPLILVSAVQVGMAIALLIFLLSLGVGRLLNESLIDGQYLRFALVAALPVLGLFGLFFCVTLITNAFQAFGPITGSRTNSRYHSAIPPNIAQAEREGFRRPHMTIQMPVYKESLRGVIKLTVASLKAAISHYELCGGSANIFVNDDGMQVISPEEAQERMDFYHDNNIGWVARPKHGENGFIRAGKFKKASNMNFALNTSNKVEEYMVAAIAEMTEKGNSITQAEEESLYQECLARVLKEDERIQAGGNIRIGEHILIVDSDTRVPADCLLYGAAEMYLSPEVAIVQHSAGVMQVVGDYFENGISFFTRLIYTSVRFSIGCGEVAPFMGHNSFIRWAAIQSVANKREDGYELYWSESHVSEDFDVALRLQIANNVVRFASYHGDAFKEGVSLTIFDELTRWEKYAYGCNELVFHPLYQWIYKGPFTPLFRRFLWSKMQLSSKITIVGYIATYYALASGLPLSLMNYFLVGWLLGSLDKFYLESWQVLVGLLFVFGFLGNVTGAILKYRLGQKSLLGALWENFKWQPMFMIFFAGLSFQLNLAILAHMLGINMEWGATAKELEQSNFFKEVPKIFKTFKWMYMCLVPIVGGMIFLGTHAPAGWEITTYTAIVPLAINVGCHFLFPFVLNPSLTVFNY